MEGTLGVSIQGPPLGPYSPAVVVETPRPPKKPVTYYPTYVTGEEIPPTAKPPVKKKAPLKKEKPAPVEEVPPPPKVKKVRPAPKPKPAPKPVEEKVVRRPRLEFRGEPIMARLPSGKYYYTDQFGKFIPPDRWKDVDVLKFIEPGPNALTQREYDAYVAELRAKEEAVKEEFAAKAAAEAEAKKAEAEAIKKAEADAAAAAKKEKPPKKGVRKEKLAAEMTKEELEALLAREMTEKLRKIEEELPSAVPSAVIPEVGFPPTTTDELQDYLLTEWDEAYKSDSIAGLKARIRKLLTVIDKGRFEELDDLQGKIQEYEDIKGRTAEAREEREGVFAEVQDALSNVAFVEEAEEVEVTARVAPGTLVSIIPSGENMITLSAAFKALQTRGVLKEWRTPAQRAVEEAKFRDILSTELENRQISGGAGAAGNLPENRRLRVEEVTGYIKRP